MKLYYTEDNWANETEVTAIVSYPKITKKNNTHSMCTVLLRDFEGALFTTWSTLDQIKMRVEDDSSNVLFRGFLINKNFTQDGLLLTIAGFGIELQWKSFGSNEIVTYILEKGKVAILNASSIIDLFTDVDEDGHYDGVSEDFTTWVADQWHDNDKDLGLLIVDNTSDYSEEGWTASALVSTGEASEVGAVADTQTFDDGNYYYLTSSSNTDCDVEFTMDNGAVIPDTNELKEIIIEFNFRLKLKDAAGSATAAAILEIKQGTEWKELIRKQKSVKYGTTITNWCIGVPSSTENGNDAEIHLYGTDTELQEYLSKDNGNYDALKGLRLYVDNMGAENYARGYVDYIAVRIKFHAEDVIPVMETITDNTLTTITCAGVADFQKLGITSGEIGNSADGFRIGQNTRVILDDISTFSGVDIEIIDGGTTYDTENIEPDTDTDCNWEKIGITHFGDVTDAVDDNMVYASAVDANEDKEETFDFDTETIDPRGYISQIVLNTRARTPISTDHRCIFDYYWDGEWQSLNEEIECGTGWTNCTNTVTGLWGDQADLDAFKIKFTSPADLGVAGSIQITEVSIDARVIIPSLHKYMAREFKGLHCSDILKSICILEGVEWCEDHDNERIKVLKHSDFESSGVSVTEADYDNDWLYEDLCNAVREVHVWGNAGYNIYAKSDTINYDSRVSKQIIDDSIMVQADAKDVANEQFTILRTKRPSIKITLDGVQSALDLGTTINITMARPTVGAEDYKIRMIEREKRGIDGIKTTVYAGLGETQYDEKIVKEIRNAADMAHKSMTDKLTSTAWASGAIITWSDVGGAAAGAVAAIESDDTIYTKTETDALLDDQIIYPTHYIGDNGFIDYSYYGAVLKVAFSDVNARVSTSYYIKDGGSFKISITHASSGANNGKTAAGVYWLSSDIDAGVQTWNHADSVVWNLVLNNAQILSIDESSAAYTFPDNSHVGFVWGKTDNAGGAAGDMRTYSIVLVRQ